MSAALAVMEDTALEAKKKDANRRWLAARKELKAIRNTAEYIAYLDDDVALPVEMQARLDKAAKDFDAARKDLESLGCVFRTAAQAAKDRRRQKTASTTLAVIDDRPLPTVVQETCMTPRDPAELTDDQLADAVIQVFAKIQDYLPYIIALKARFSDGDRDSENHLLTPIKGCYSWKEFCASILNRSPEALRQAIAAAKKTKEAAHAVTEAEFAEYEQENQGIRKLTEKLLADGLPESDVVSALVNMEHPQPMAEAAVRIVSAKMATNPIDADAAAVSAAANNLALELSKIFKCADVQRANEIGKFHVSVAVHGITEDSVRSLAEFVKGLS
jgi:hypothetical protein